MRRQTKKERMELLMFSFLNDANNYAKQKVERTELANGLIVSTAHTSNEGYETAILDANNAHPVERYPSKGRAIIGHEKWVEFARKYKGEKVTKLGGLGGLVEDSEIKLKFKKKGG